VSGKATDEDEATDKATEHKATERKAADKAAATDDDEGTATETHTRPEVDLVERVGGCGAGGHSGRHERG
jgi:hypothetical protein